MEDIRQENLRFPVDTNVYFQVPSLEAIHHIKKTHCLKNIQFAIHHEDIASPTTW
jgi:hypothetical protein